jgi:hypothetical protein
MDRNRVAMFFKPKSPQGRPEEAFVQCPELFLHGLTPEEYRALQQIYRQAFERAQAQVQQEQDHYGTGSGDGI